MSREIDRIAVAIRDMTITSERRAKAAAAVPMSYICECLNMMFESCRYGIYGTYSPIVARDDSQDVPTGEQSGAPVDNDWHLV